MTLQDSLARLLLTPNLTQEQAKQVFHDHVQTMTLDELFEEYVDLSESEPERSEFDTYHIWRDEVLAEIRARLAAQTEVKKQTPEMRSNIGMAKWFNS